MGKLLLPEHDWVSLVELSRYRSDQTRDTSGESKLAFTFLDSGEREGAKLSYEALDRRARAIAAQLQKTAKLGDRALLLYPPGLDFVEAFFGCLYAGVIAVPAYPPDPTRMARTLPRLMAIANDAQTSMVLTGSGTAPGAMPGAAIISGTRDEPSRKVILNHSPRSPSMSP